MSVSWEPPTSRHDSGYVVFFAEFDPATDDDPEGVPLCLHCLLEDGHTQLGLGLDLARVHGQVDWDAEAGEWVVDEDRVERP
jgi:hypothetical protein